MTSKTGPIPYKKLLEWNYELQAEIKLLKRRVDFIDKKNRYLEDRLYHKNNSVPQYSKIDKFEKKKPVFKNKVKK